jgi:hypothetical protein
LILTWSCMGNHGVKASSGNHCRNAHNLHNCRVSVQFMGQSSLAVLLIALGFILKQISGFSPALFTSFL